MVLRKIKDLRRVGKSGGARVIPESEKEKMRIRMIKNNPMKNPEIAKKNALARKGKPNPETRIRNELNNPMKNPHTKDKRAISMKGKKNIKGSINRLGKRVPALEPYQFTAEQMIKNNPMKNPEIAKKNALARKGKKLSQSTKDKIKSNINVIKNFFKRKVTPEMEQKIIELYTRKNPLSPREIAPLFGLHANGIKRILKRNKIYIRNRREAYFVLANRNKKEVDNEDKNIDSIINNGL